MNGTVSCVVRRREGGSRARKKRSTNSSSSEAAENFRDLVDAHGPHWPYGWVRGEDFVEPGTSARASVAEAVFEPFALRYIELLTGVQGDTKAKTVVRSSSGCCRGSVNSMSLTGLDKNRTAACVNDLAEGVEGPYARREGSGSLGSKSMRAFCCSSSCKLRWRPIRRAPRNRVRRS